MKIYGVKKILESFRDINHNFKDKILEKQFLKNVDKIRNQRAYAMELASIKSILLSMSKQKKDENIPLVVNLMREGYIEANDGILDIDDVIEIIKTLPGEKREKYIQEFEDDAYKCEIIKSLPEEKREKYIQEFENDRYKYEIIKSLPEEKREKYIQEFENDRDKYEIIKSLPEEKREKYIQEFENDRYKYEIIKLLPEEKREKYIQGFEEEYCKYEIVKSLSEEKREEYIQEFEDDRYKYGIVESLSEERREKCIQEFEDDKYKYQIVKNLSEEKREKYIQKFEKEYYKSEIVKSLSEEKREKYIQEFEDESYRIEIIQGIEDEDILRRSLFEKKLISIDGIREIRRNLDDKFIIQNIEYFLEVEGVDSTSNTKDTLQRMWQVNNDVVKNIDFRMLDDKILNVLGEEKINVISCFSEIQNQIVNLDKKQLDIFSKCLDLHMEKYDSTEWSILANELLEKMPQYNKLLNDINITDEIDIEKLMLIMQNDNVFGIQSKMDIERYSDIKKKKCDEWINSDDIETKKLAIIEKVFGHDLRYMRKILGIYGEDIENLPDSPRKDYIQALKEITNLKDKKCLDKIYEEINEIEFIDKIGLESELRNDYAMQYNNGLLKAENCEQIEEGVYNAGTDFKILMTSISAYSGRNRRIINYKADWNRPSLDSNHYCASYIRNDMIGTAPVRNICYGFSSVEKDSLLLSGTSDISSTSKLTSTAYGSQEFNTPDSQINKTGKNAYKYNEMDFKRNSNGVKKQPDYILVFKKNGEIENMDKAKQAQQDWNGLPIVVVDKDACLESERNKLENMMKEYKENHSTELAGEIWQKIRNNRITSEDFEAEINLEEWKNKSQEKQESNQIHESEVQTKEESIICENDLKANYENVNATQRKQVVNKIKAIINKEKSKEAVKDGEI